jgi:hypothetical protein
MLAANQPHTTAFGRDKFHASVFKGAVGLDAKPAITGHHRSRFNSSFAKALLAARWIYFATGLNRLPYLGKSRSLTSAAFDFCDSVFSFGSFHEIHLFGKRGKTISVIIK